MKLNDFIGKVVISKESKAHYIITRIDGTAIYAKTQTLNSSGNPSSYLWETGTGPYNNAIANGTLIFEDEKLYEPFVNAYESYIHNDGRLDQYDYYSTFYD